MPALDVMRGQKNRVPRGLCRLRMDPRQSSLKESHLSGGININID